MNRYRPLSLLPLLVALAACAPADAPPAGPDPAAGVAAADAASLPPADAAGDAAGEAPPQSAEERAALAEAALLADAAERAVRPERAPGAPVADGRSTFEFWFSSLAPGAEDPRIVGWIEDPCGMTPVAVVATMPLDDASLLPDYVVEFAADGRELMRWGKPYSAEIVTIDGDELVFRANHDGNGARDFRTDPRGAIAAADGRIASTITGSASPRACPALPAFAGSDFVQCFEVRDADGGTRLLAWEGACS